MITGDNALTAKAIADKVGLKSKGVINGEDLDGMDEDQLKKRLDEGVNIFARTTPLHKFNILKVLQRASRVAMTGDGVNDALALKEADVGIAMNIKGTEVAKEASDMILLDDKFTTIVDSVKEGRKIFDNTRKFVNYLFVCNFAEVAVLFFATLFLTLKEPILLPVQLLWINLLTDGMPALALGVDSARKDIMSEPPRRKNEPIINKRLGWLIGAIGLKKTLVLFGTFFLAWSFVGIEEAKTTLFTGFILYEFVRIGSIRYQDKLGWFSNKWLVFALIGSLLLQLLIVYSPLGSYFGIVPLSLIAWGFLIGGVIVGYITAIWITKLVMRYVKG
jgi:Ca2+-transporting ATPase